jgi:hypothetical protein
MKVSELSGAMLDYWVAKAEGKYSPNPEKTNMPLFWSPSTLWEHGGPIIQRERIAVIPDISTKNDRVAGIAEENEPTQYYRGDTALKAAMRCYVAWKFGDEVNDELG